MVAQLGPFAIVRLLGGISTKGAAARLSVTQLSDALGKLEKIGGFSVAAAGLDLLADKSVEALEAAAKLERSQLTIEALTERTGFAAGRTADQIEKLAQEIGKSTEASTSEMRAAATQLLAFRSVSRENFDDTLRLAQDLAAVGFGDVKTNTVSLAKALQNPVAGLKSLTDFGAEFDAQEQELVRGLVDSGRTFEAGKVLLGELEGLVGGVGAKQAGGLTGAVDNLSDERNRLLENFGDGKPLELATEGVRELSEGVEFVNQEFFPDLETQIREAEAKVAKVLEASKLPEGALEFMGKSREGPNQVGIDEENQELRLLLERLEAERQAEDRARVKSLELQKEREEAIGRGSVSSETQADQAILGKPQQVQEQTLTLFMDLLSAIEPLAGGIGETNRLLEERLPELTDTPVAGQGESVAPVEGIPGETARLLHDVLTELMRFLQAIETPALPGRHCEGGGPGPSQPGLPGSEDLAGGALCPTEELERQRDCLLTESGEATNGLQAGLLAYAQSALDVNDQVKAATLSAFQGMEDALVQFVETGKVDFKSLADSIIADLIRIAIRSAILGPLANAIAGAFGSGGGVSTRTPGEQHPGVGDVGNTINFAQGGAFTVGGSGGTDSQMVRFRATPGERVTVTRPDQMRQGVVLNVQVNNNAPGVEVQSRASGDPANPTVMLDIVRKDIADNIRRGGSVLQAIEQTTGARRQPRAT